MTDVEKRALQKRALSNLLTYREDGYPTYFSYVKKSSGKYVQIVLLYGLLGVGCLVLGHALLGCFLLGALWGILFRDFQWTHSQNAFWPIHQQLLDWEKIEFLYREFNTEREQRT